MSAAEVGTMEQTSRWRRRHNRMGYWYILPAFVLFSFMVAYPIVRSFYLSFYEFSVLEPDSAKFVALDNYVKLATSTPNRGPLWNTLYFTLIFVPPYVLLSLVIAVMLNAVRRGSVFLRTMIFTPVVVSLAVSAVMWVLFYDSRFGMAQEAIVWTCNHINYYAGRLGIGPIATAPEAGVLGDPSWAMIGIAVMCFWNGVGINIILYLVGLQRIPDDLYEAARVDGAGAWQRFWHITLPQLRPTIYLVVLLSLIGAFKIFGQPYIMTGGGPQDSTMTYVMRLYNLAFRYGKFKLGYASSLAYALALFIFVMSLFLRKLNRPVE
ncbi:MAG: hypothetical protein AMS16_04020 [Planctomycetes bacterium DG_58]|nr:MAG: hypothetical protein AMS16_04020 [Planctomycetes bacterium DG_58]